jgi:hypothetical protein
VSLSGAPSCTVRSLPAPLVFILLRIPHPLCRRSRAAWLKSLADSCAPRLALFSATYKTLSAQPLSFHIHPNPRGVAGALLRDHSIFQHANSFPCHTYKIDRCKSFPCHTSEKPGGWGPLTVNCSHREDARVPTKLVPRPATCQPSATVLESTRTTYEHS